MGVAGGGEGHGGHDSPPQSIQDKNKVLGNYDKHLRLRDCFLAGLLTSFNKWACWAFNKRDCFLAKEKCNTTLLFALARVVLAQPQWPANGQASLQLFKTNLCWHIIFSVLRIA